MKRHGARVHPRSGAGSIKGDGSNEDTLFEHKLAKRSHTLKGKDLADLYRRAVRQGLDAVYLVEFDNDRIRLVCHVESY